MRKRSSTVLIITAVSALAALPLLVKAQWNPDEGPERLQERQWDRTLQHVEDRKEGTDVVVPPKPTPEGIAIAPTGFVHREFTIREYNLGGEWGERTIRPSFGFQDGWHPMDAESYKQELSKGIVDGKLGKTDYSAYLTQMKKACADGVSAKGAIHLRALNDPPAWLTSQRSDPPYTMMRVLLFACLAEGSVAALKEPTEIP